MTRDEFIAEAKRQGKSKEETLAKYEQLVASGAFDEAQKEPRPMDQRIGTDSAEGEFDRYRPRLADDYVGEDWGRSIDAAVMGAGEQIRSFQRGFENLNPFQTGAEEDELDRQAKAAENFAEAGYGTSNPIATSVGEFATTAPTMLLLAACQCKWRTAG
jgi:hypothetical protein